MNQERNERLDYYVNLAKTKEFRQETIEMGYMLSMSTQMIEKFGTKEKSLEEVIRLCEKNNNPREFIGAIGDLIGLNS